MLAALGCGSEVPATAICPCMQRHGSPSITIKNNNSPYTYMLPFDPSSFTVKAPKPLPVLLLLDVSGSMSTHMDTLNAAVRDMLDAFAEEEKMETLIKVAVITFETNAVVLNEFTDASILRQSWRNLIAGGTTNLESALELAKAMLEDKNRTPSRAYRPTVVLLSDGYPDSGWEHQMNAFIHEGRSAKCDRMSMAIGGNADENMLRLFLTNTGHELQYAHDASGIKRFFKLVTMSTLLRTRSQNPNVIPSMADVDTDDD